MHAPSGAVKRCDWARGEMLGRYHDLEWAKPVHDDRALFEILTLEGAQAGLSWEIVLRKRDRYRALFYDFEPARVARVTPKRIDRILQDPGIVRNRAKVQSAVGNARAILKLCEEFGSFDRFVWRFVDGAPIRNAWRSANDIPASTPLSERMSRELRARGFRFVGPTICYAFMQAAGLVNDHLIGCAFRDRGS